MNDGDSKTGEKDGDVPATELTEQPLLITADLLATPAVERRIDFEKGISHWPPVTLVLIAINAALFVWEIATGALENAQTIIAAGALHKPEVMRGEYWRLLSCMFLHGDAVHLVGNCTALYALGIACEHAFGSLHCLAIYFLAGLGASLLSMFTEPGPTIGASGAIFGLMGCVATFLHINRHKFYVRDARISFVLAIWAAYTLLTGWFDPHIANMAHLGGFLAGALLALVVKPTLLPAK